MKAKSLLMGLAMVLASEWPAHAMGYGAGMGGGTGKVPMLLLALAAGYGVLVISQGQKRPLDVLGRLLGSVILIVSFVGLICIAVCAGWCGSKGKMMCSVGSAKMDCHSGMDAGAQTPKP